MNLSQALVAVALIVAVVVFRVTGVIGDGDNSLLGATIAALFIYWLVVD